MTTDAYKDIIYELENQLELLKRQSLDKIVLFEKAIGLCTQAIHEIKELVFKNGFSSNKDEINFFKQIKPQVNSRLIFYIRLFEIETHRRDASKEIQIKYLEKEHKTIFRYFEENNEFCQYYRRKQTCLDQIYFIRGNKSLRIHPDSFMHMIDPDFSTAYDQTVAKIIANEQLVKYLEHELHKLKHGEEDNNFEEFLSTFHWGNSNTDLIELIYALDSAKVINNGNVEIKELVKAFEKLFNVKLENVYRTFQEIQRRKKDKTKFLNSLIDALNKRMDDLDV